MDPRLGLSDSVADEIQYGYLTEGDVIIPSSVWHQTVIIKLLGGENY